MNISKSLLWCRIESLKLCGHLKQQSKRDQQTIRYVLCVKKNRWKHCLSFQVTTIFKGTSKNIIYYHSSKPEADSSSPKTSNHSSGGSWKVSHCRRTCLQIHQRKSYFSQNVYKQVWWSQVILENKRCWWH